jgi:hypothetical protein
VGEDTETVGDFSAEPERDAEPEGAEPEGAESEGTEPEGAESGDSVPTVGRDAEPELQGGHQEIFVHQFLANSRNPPFIILLVAFFLCFIEYFFIIYITIY